MSNVATTSLLSPMSRVLPCAVLSQWRQKVLISCLRHPHRNHLRQITVLSIRSARFLGLHEDLHSANVLHHQHLVLIDRPSISKRWSQPKQGCQHHLRPCYDSYALNYPRSIPQHLLHRKDVVLSPSAKSALAHSIPSDGTITHVLYQLLPPYKMHSGGACDLRSRLRVRDITIIYLRSQGF